MQCAILRYSCDRYSAVETVTLDAYVVRTLMRDLIGHDHSPAAFAVYLWLAAAGDRTAISYAALAEETGLSRSAAQAAVACLVGRELLRVEKVNATAVPVYTVLRPWRQRPKR